MRPLHLPFAAVVAGSTALGATITQPPETSIRLTTGETITGQVTGLLVLKRVATTPDKGVAYLVVDGTHVTAIDEKGVHLTKEAVVRSLFVEGRELVDPSPLGMAYRFSSSLGGAMVGRLGVGEGCCLISSIRVDLLADPVLGEFRSAATSTIVQAIEVQTVSAKRSIPINELVPVILGVAAHGQASSSVKRNVKLTTPWGIVTSAEITNTHVRDYTDPIRPPSLPPAPPVPNRCSLDKTTPGVVWKFVLTGATVPAKEIRIAEEAGTTFTQVCWTSSGSVFQIDAAGNRTGGGPQTEILAAGPDEAKRLSIAIRSAAATIEITR